MTSRHIAWVALGLLAGALLVWWSSERAAEPDPAVAGPTRTEPARAVEAVVVDGGAPAREPAPAASLAAAVHDIEVLVRDAREQPVQGASLVLSRDGEEWLSESQLSENVVGTTDAEGRATLRGVDQALCFVAAVKVPVGTSAFREVSDKGRVELTLAACDSEVRGQVVDHRGGGVGGASVELQQWLPIECGMSMSLCRPVPKPPSALEVRRRVLTAADGTFVFRASRSWEQCIVLCRVARLRCDAFDFVTIGEDRDLRFEVPGRVMARGVVLDWRGAPVSGCEVWAGDPDLDISFDGSTGSLVTADAAGQFEVPLSKGGSYLFVPLGTAIGPAGRPKKISLVEGFPTWIELRTAEPASIRCRAVGMRGRPTRIVARPRDCEDGRTREVLLAGDGEFTLPGLMRRTSYFVIAYQDGNEVARGWATADDQYAGVLRHVDSGLCVLSCTLGGDGLRGIGGAQAQIAVHPVDEKTNAPKLERAVTAVDWRGEAEVKFDDLPARAVAVAVLLVDGVELGRSGPFRLHNDSAAAAVIDVEASGTIEAIPAHAKADWLVEIQRPDGMELQGRKRSWQDAGALFRCSLPAGDYVVRFGYAGGDRELRDAPCTVVTGTTTQLRLP